MFLRYALHTTQFRKFLRQLCMCAPFNCFPPGIIVLQNAPFNVKKWRKIPQKAEDKIVSKVLVNCNLVFFYSISLLLWSTSYSFHFNHGEDTFDIDNTKHNKDAIYLFNM